MMWGYHVENVFAKAIRSREQVDTTSSDLWAKQRQKELEAQGYNTSLVRRSKRESLCIVYNTRNVQKACVC
jgi:hypothetical protein